MKSCKLRNEGNITIAKETMYNRKAINIVAPCKANFFLTFKKRLMKSTVKTAIWKTRLIWARNGSISFTLASSKHC